MLEDQVVVDSPAGFLPAQAQPCPGQKNAIRV
jgi:hypothetical protein